MEHLHQKISFVPTLSQWFMAEVIVGRRVFGLADVATFVAIVFIAVFGGTTNAPIAVSIGCN